MARGNPDYRVSSNKYGQTSTDVLELAARLGSVSTVDRRGTVLFIDHFDNLLTPYIVNTSGLALLDVRNTVCYTGDKACRLYTPAALGQYSYIAAFNTPYGGTKIGFETCLNWGTAIPAAPAPTQVIMSLYKSNRVYTFKINIDHVNDVLQYWGYVVGVPAWITFKSGLGFMGIYPYDDWYHYCKLVVNMVTGTYERFVFNGNEYNLQTLIAPNGVSVRADSFLAQVRLDSILTVTTVYIGYYILTTDEP